MVITASGVSSVSSSCIAVPDRRGLVIRHRTLRLSKRTQFFHPVHPVGLHRLECCHGMGERIEIGHNTECGAEYAAYLAGLRMHLDDRHAARHVEQRVTLRHRVAEARTDRQDQVGLLDLGDQSGSEPTPRSPTKLSAVPLTAPVAGNRQSRAGRCQAGSRGSRCPTCRARRSSPAHPDPAALTQLRSDAGPRAQAAGGARRLMLDRGRTYRDPRLPARQ